MSKPRVCHITTVHTVKDTRIYHKECRALAEAGYDVKLVAVNAADTTSDYPGVEIISIGLLYKSKIQRMMQAPRKVRLVAEELKADVYHFHDPEFMLSAMIMSMRGNRVVYDIHEDVPNQVRNKAWIPRILRRLLSASIRVLESVVVSRIAGFITVVDPIMDRLSQFQKSSVIVANYPSMDEMPEPTPWSEKKSQLCYVGDLSAVRGVKTMIDALANQYVDLLLGGKFSSDEFKSSVQESPGWKRVNELGFLSRKEVMEVYSESKIGMVVLHPTPSYKEAIPVKMLEYMAAGMPFVASDFGWIKEVVEKHKCGVLVDPLSPDSITNGITYLLSNDAEARRMGERGRRAVIEFYNWESERQKLLGFYSNILKNV